MGTTASPIQVTLILASALLAGAIGVLATLRRGHWLTTLLFSAAFLSMAAFQAGTLGILDADPVSVRGWAVYLARTSALASWLWLTLSLVLARRDPWNQLRNAGVFLGVALVGCIGMSVLGGSPHVVREVRGTGGAAVVVLGTLGKIYLMYLVVVLVAVLMNLERMLRSAPPTALQRLRPMFVAFLVGILSQLLVISGGLLYNGLRVSWLVLSAVPMFVAGIVTAFGLAQRRLSDLSVPVARPVIYYSSVSLTLAAAFLLAMAVLSRVLPVLTPEWKRVVSVAFYLLVGGGGLYLTVSAGANRAVRRFIDRNFYANRYDYRREWERVSSAFMPGGRPEDLAPQVENLIRTVFDVEKVAVYLRDDLGGPLRRVHGPATLPATLESGNTLVRHFATTRHPIVFREVARDPSLIPVAVDNRAIVESLPAAVSAPLHSGEPLVGVLWLSPKRGQEEFSFEDIEFLGTLSRHVGAILWASRQSVLLAETRQLESLNRLSAFVLHDIKNHISGLSLVVENARRHLSNPEFQRDALVVVERTVVNLRELMNQVASVARPPDVTVESVEVLPLLQRAAAAAGLNGDTDGVRFRMECSVSNPVRLDPGLVVRVLSNLLINAREAVGGSGEIRVTANVTRHDAGNSLRFEVTDTGRGMTEEFIRTALFRPFASSKAGGLGLGLSQSKSIIEAHGGSIEVTSQPGSGSCFAVTLPLDRHDSAPGAA